MITIKTEYLITGFEDFKQAIVYEDYIDENGKIKYGISRKKLSPYFYVLEDAFVPEDRCIVKVEPGYVGVCGEKLKRVYTRLPTDVSAVRSYFAQTWESDVLYPWRQRINNGYIIKDNVKLYLDIEVAMGDRFDRTSFRYPIIAVSIYDSKSKEYVVFTWRGDLDRAILSEKRLERIKRKDEESYREMMYRIYTFPNEKEMVVAMCKYIVAISPDILSSWNTSFDYPYIINRMHSLQTNPGMLSPINFVSIDKYDGEAIIKGRYVLDLLGAYRKRHIGQLESFALTDVGLFEFKVPKIKVDGNFEELWKRDINALVEYNIADLELIVRLDEEKNIIKFFENVSNDTGVPLDETLSNSRVLDFFYLKEAYKDGICLPAAVKDNPPSDFEGALVIEPTKGLHHNVACFDLTALYPNIIVAGNMSLETIDLDGDIKFGNGISFRSSPEGFISSRIRYFLERRAKIKKEMLVEFKEHGKSERYKILDAEQNVAKFLANSIFGILGFSKSRYYVSDIAKTITWVGRMINQHTQKIVEDNGFKIIAGDTDSVYVKFPDEYDLDECLSVGKELQDKINNSYVGFAEKFGIKNMTFDIKYEKLFRKFIACRKKRYLGQLWFKEGIIFDEDKYGKDIEVTGFGSRRSDTSVFTKAFLKELYGLLISEVPASVVYKFILGKVEEFKKANVEDIALPKNFTKEFNQYEGGSGNSVFINSAKMCNQRYGMDIGGGSKILFIYAKTAPGGFCWSRGDSDILKREDIRVDYSKMIERGIYMPIVALFEALNMSVEDLKSGTSQLKLEEFC